MKTRKIGARRLLSLILSVVILVGVIPFSAIPVSAAVVKNRGYLTISTGGQGYTEDEYHPFSVRADKTTDIYDYEEVNVYVKCDPGYYFLEAPTVTPTAVEASSVGIAPYSYGSEYVFTLSNFFYPYPTGIWALDPHSKVNAHIRVHVNVAEIEKLEATDLVFSDEFEVPEQTGNAYRGASVDQIVWDYVTSPKYLNKDLVNNDFYISDMRWQPYTEDIEVTPQDPSWQYVDSGYTVSAVGRKPLTENTALEEEKYALRVHLASAYGKVFDVDDALDYHLNGLEPIRAKVNGQTYGDDTLGNELVLLYIYKPTEPQIMFKTGITQPSEWFPNGSVAVGDRAALFADITGEFDAGTGQWDCPMITRNRNGTIHQTSPNMIEFTPSESGEYNFIYTVQKQGVTFRYDYAVNVYASRPTMNLSCDNPNPKLGEWVTITANCSGYSGAAKIQWDIRDEHKRYFGESDATNTTFKFKPLYDGVSYDVFLQIEDGDKCWVKGYSVNATHPDDPTVKPQINLQYATFPFGLNQRVKLRATSNRNLRFVQWDMEDTEGCTSDFYSIQQGNGIPSIYSVGKHFTATQAGLYPSTLEVQDHETGFYYIFHPCYAIDYTEAPYFMKHPLNKFGDDRKTNVAYTFEAEALNATGYNWHVYDRGEDQAYPWSTVRDHATVSGENTAKLVLTPNDTWFNDKEIRCGAYGGSKYAESEPAYLVLSHEAKPEDDWVTYIALEAPDFIPGNKISQAAVIPHLRYKNLHNDRMTVKQYKWYVENGAGDWTVASGDIDYNKRYRAVAYIDCNSGYEMDPALLGYSQEALCAAFFLMEHPKYLECSSGSQNSRPDAVYLNFAGGGGEPAADFKLVWDFEPLLQPEAPTNLSWSVDGKGNIYALFSSVGRPFRDSMWAKDFILTLEKDGVVKDEITISYQKNHNISEAIQKYGSGTYRYKVAYIYEPHTPYECYEIGQTSDWSPEMDLTPKDKYKLTVIHGETVNGVYEYMDGEEVTVRSVPPMGYSRGRNWKVESGLEPFEDDISDEITFKMPARDLTVIDTMRKDYSVRNIRLEGKTLKWDAPFWAEDVSKVELRSVLFAPVGVISTDEDYWDQIRYEDINQEVTPDASGSYSLDISDILDRLGEGWYDPYLFPYITEEEKYSPYCSYLPNLWYGPDFTVSFDANGGDGSMDTVTAGGAYILPECTFTAPADKRAFSHWALGNADGTYYNVGDAYYPSVEGESVTFYAVWTNKGVQAPLTITGLGETVGLGESVKPGVSGGSGSGAVRIEVTFGTGEVEDRDGNGTYTATKAGTVTFKAIKEADADYERAESEPVTVTITVLSELIPGDVNGDKLVNMKDVLLLRKFIAEMAGVERVPAMDVNEDGNVNMKDVLMLRKMIAGIAV